MIGNTRVLWVMEIRRLSVPKSYFIRLFYKNVRASSIVVCSVPCQGQFLFGDDISRINELSGDATLRQDRLSRSENWRTINRLNKNGTGGWLEQKSALGAVRAASIGTGGSASMEGCEPAGSVPGRNRAGICAAEVLGTVPKVPWSRQRRAGGIRTRRSGRRCGRRGW